MQGIWVHAGPAFVMPAHITAGMKLEWAEPVDADEEDYEVGIFLTAIHR